MAKALNVSLQVSADTGQAKQALQSLQQQLTQLTTTPANLTIGGDIKQGALEASKAIAQLQTALKSSTNSLTGNLNLTKFNQEMTQSGMSLQKYQTQLQAMGPAGQKAFAQLASSIAQAEVPLRRTNGLFTELWTTMKNTARWQISSSILHGFMGAIQGAYRYAQDLNKSLTDIQIVTQASDEHMAQFAKTANTAAKQLSTTTNSYAKASLIYYQQGLGDKEVKERTDATIKMANVTGQSAQQVSDQMTAIWNNFDNGSHSLEYYADVITALGAATASSSEEISRGLEKFAAIADTVGLSYENATAALATITATTRQSADSVGTGLRTLFSRLQSLKLGETLEDGVDLTKYSKALKTIGVDVLDATGNLRDMDDILEDMGAQWDKLNNAQKTAVAQTVGGVRQYTTLMALMENFDFYKQNQQIAENSEGTLQKQQAIYEKSWQAASKRVRASAESIYSDLLDDKFFIKLTNGFGKFLDLIHNTIQGLGGLKGVLLAIGTLMTTVFADKTAQRLQNMVYDLKMLTPKGRAEVQGLQQQGAQMLANSVYAGKDQYSQTMSTAYSQQGALQAAYLTNAERMGAAQQQVAQSLMQQQAALIQNVDLQAQAVQKAQQEADLQERTSKMALRDLYTVSSLEKTEKNGLYGDLKTRVDTAAELSTYQGQADSFITGLNALKNAGQDFNLDHIKQQFQDFPNLLKGFGATSFEAANKFKAFAEAVNSGDLTKVKTAFNELWDAFKAPMGDSSLGNIKDSIHKLATELGGEDTEAVKKFEQELEKLFSKKYNQGTLDFGLKEQVAGLTTYTDRLKAAMAELANKPFTAMDGMVAMAGTLSSIGMTITQINGLIDVWNNKDLTFGQKITSTLTSLGLIIPMITRAFGPESIAKINGFYAAIKQQKQVNSAMGALSTAEQGVANAGNAAGNLADAAAANEAAVAELKLAAAKAVASGASKEAVATSLVRAGLLQDEAVAALMAGGATEEEAIAAYKAAVANLGLAGSTTPVTAGFASMAAAIWSAMWPILAIAAAIAAIVVVVKGIDGAIETTSEAGERLASATNTAAEAANNAKQAYQDLLNGFESHSSLLDTLNELTAGTLEFKEALLEANMAAQEIIDNNNMKLGTGPSDTEGDYYYDSNGAIQFTEAGKQRATEAAYNDMVTKQDNLVHMKMLSANNDYQQVQSIMSSIAAAEAQAAADGGVAYTPTLDRELDTWAVNHGFKNGEAVRNASADEIMTRSGAREAFQSTLLNEAAKDGNVSETEQMLASIMAADYSAEDLARYQNASKTIHNQNGEAIISDVSTKGIFTSDWWAGNQTKAAYQDYYKQVFGEEAFNNLTEDQQADTDYLRSAMQAQEMQNLMQQDYRRRLELANSQELADYRNHNKKTGQQLADMSKELEEDRSDYEELLALKESGTELTEEQQRQLDEFELRESMLDYANKQRAKKIGTYTSQAQTLGLSGIVNQDFVNGLTGDQLDTINSLTGNFFSTYGKESASVIFKALNQPLEDGSFNKQLAAQLSNIELTGNPIEDLFNIKHMEGLREDIRTELFEGLKKDVGGDAGLLESLFNSEGFQDNLKDLQKEFKKTGKISAKSILEMADSSEELADMLDIVDANAQGVADALAALESGNVQKLTNALVAAFSAAGELENNLAKTYDYIDNFEEERSIQDIGDFYKKRADAVQAGFESGMLLDAPLLQSMEALFGAGKRSEYQHSIYDLTNDRNLTPDQISDAINTQYAAEIAAMQSIQKRGNLSGMFEYYDSRLQAGGQDMFDYDTKTGQVVAKSREELSAMGYDSQDAFIQGLQDNYGMTEDMARSMASEYAATNGNIAQLWRETAAQNGIDKLLDTGNGEVLTGDQLRAFYDQYADVLQDMEGFDTKENFLAAMAAQAEATGKAFVDLGENFKFSENSYEDFREAYNKSRSEQTGQDEDWLQADWTKQGIVERNATVENGQIRQLSSGIDFDAGVAELQRYGATLEEAYSYMTQFQEAESAATGETAYFEKTIHNADGTTQRLTSSSQAFTDWAAQNGTGDLARDFAAWTTSIQDSEDALAAAQQQTDILAQAFVKSFAGIEGEGIDVKFTGDTSGLEAVQTIISGFENDSVDLKFSTPDGSPIQSVIDSFQGQTVTVGITATPTSVTISAGASGYNNAKGFAGGKHSNGQYEGLAEVGELGPELFIHDGQPYLAGVNGRTKAYVHKDDSIYTAAQTKKILEENPSLQDIPGFSVGYNPIRWGSSGSNASGGNAKTSKYDPERYHLITRQLKDLEREYDRLNKIKEKAYGTNILKGIQAEIDATDELIKGQKALIREAEDYLKIDLDRLKDLTKNDNIDIKFDANGNIENFEKLQEKYRKAAEEDKDEHAQDVWKALQQYEETLDKLHEAETELQNYIYQLAELQLEKITTKLELKIDFDDKELDFIDYQLKKIGDSVYATADAIAKASEKIGWTADKITGAQASINELFANMVDSKGNKIVNPETGQAYTLQEWLDMTPQQREDLDIHGDWGKAIEDNLDTIMQAMEDLEDMKTTGIDKFKDAFNELNNKISETVENFEHYKKVLSTLKDIVGLQGLKLSPEMKELIQTINESSFNNIQNQIDAQQRQYEDAKKKYADLKATAEAFEAQYGKDDARTIEAWGMVAEQEKNLQSLQENLFSSWQEGAELAKTIFDEMMDSIVEKYEASIAGMYGNINDFQKAWDQHKKNDDFYVKDYERYYQISKLQRSITRDLENAAKAGNRQNERMKRLYNDLNDARAEGAEVTAYDLDIFAKRYEYEKALMELEDARNAKNEVRLQRDANGNWGYVYTSAEDEDDITAKQQRVEDTFYELQKASQERLANLQDDMMSEMAGVGARLKELYAEGASPEVIQDYLASVQKTLNNTRYGIQKALEDAGMTEEEAKLRYGAAGFDILDNFNETLLSQITGEESLDELMKLLGISITGADEAMQTEAEKYEKRIQAINSWFEENGEDFSQVITGLVGQVSAESQEAVKKTQDAIDESAKYIKAAYDAMIEFNGKWDEQMAKLVGVDGYLRQVLTALHALNDDDEKHRQESNTANFDSGGYTGSWGTSGKIAILHEKENVFDKFDTLNLLNAAQILRTLDLQTNLFSKGLGNIMTPFIDDIKSQILDQNVHIDASFPNVTDHNEIELAFDNLINKASQYANRKNMSAMTFQDMYTNQF